MRKVLVVEDDSIMRDTIRDILQFEGLEVEAVNGGVEAINRLASTSYNLVITDIIMPNRDGYEVIHAALTACPSTKILAISGGGSVSSEAYLAMAKDVGAHSILSKPFDIDELLMIVRNAYGTQIGIVQ